MNAPVYFAQISDIHVGNNNLNPEAARRNLRAALEEIAAWPVPCACILATADLVCSGREDELREYCELVASTATPIPILAVPANHDLWGQEGEEAWETLLGPARHVVDTGGLRIVAMQDICRREAGGWHAHVSEGQLAWLDQQLAGHEGSAVLAVHAPILPVGDGYHDVWKESNADALLDVLRRRRVLAVLSGHWHRLGQWDADGVRVINSGSLCGWQWTGIPPYHSFPVRAGYSMYRYAGGELTSSWRDLYWQEMRAQTQVNLVWVGPVHTGGPRPQVRPAHIFSPVVLEAHTWSLGAAVSRVQWRCPAGPWQDMYKRSSGLWDVWEASFDAAQVGSGSRTLAVRAWADGRVAAYDAVPISVSEAQSPAPCAAVPGREQVFELFYTAD